jgi:hypothetical protein
MIVAAFYLLDTTAAALYVQAGILVVVLYRLGIIFAALYMDPDDNTLQHRAV